MKPIKDCLNPQLIKICQHTKQLETLNETLKRYLSSPLVDHCQVGHFAQGCLVITTTSSSWATELRYSLPNLRDKLRKEAGLYQLASIKIQIIEQTTQPTTPAKSRNKVTLSAAAREIIENAAAQSTYPPLQDALYKLSQTTNY